MKACAASGDDDLGALFIATRALLLLRCCPRSTFCDARPLRGVLESALPSLVSIPGQRGLPLPALAPTRAMLQKLSEAEKVPPTDVYVLLSSSGQCDGLIHKGSMLN